MTASQLSSLAKEAWVLFSIQAAILARDWSEASGQDILIIPCIESTNLKHMIWCLLFESNERERYGACWQQMELGAIGTIGHI